MSAAVISLIWWWIFQSQGGLLNFYLKGIGMPTPRWLSTMPFAMWTIVIATVWWTMGYNMIILLAALQDIPQEVMEAAAIDGARSWATFRSIILPTIRPVTVFLVVWGLIDTFQFFDLVFTTTKGGPLYSTITLVYYIWELAFNFFTAGYGAAVAYVLFFSTLIAIIVGLVYARRRGMAL